MRLTVTICLSLPKWFFQSSLQMNIKRGRYLRLKLEIVRTCNLPMSEHHDETFGRKVLNRWRVSYISYQAKLLKENLSSFHVYRSNWEMSKVLTIFTLNQRELFTFKCTEHVCSNIWQPSKITSLHNNNNHIQDENTKCVCMYATNTPGRCRRKEILIQCREMLVHIAPTVTRI